MSVPSVHKIVNGYLVNVQMIDMQTDALLIIKGDGQAGPATRINMKPFQRANLTIYEALEYVMNIAEASVRAVTS
jgi:hypothetical protein